MKTADTRNRAGGVVRENRPDGAGAGSIATEPRAGLFYLMATHDRQQPLTNPFLISSSKMSERVAMRRAEGEREGEEIPLAG